MYDAQESSWRLFAKRVMCACEVVTSVRTDERGLLEFPVGAYLILRFVIAVCGTIYYIGRSE